MDVCPLAATWDKHTKTIEAVNTVHREQDLYMYYRCCLYKQTEKCLQDDKEMACSHKTAGWKRSWKETQSPLIHVPCMWCGPHTTHSPKTLSVLAKRWKWEKQRESLKVTFNPLCKASEIQVWQVLSFCCSLSIFFKFALSLLCIYPGVLINK